MLSWPAAGADLADTVSRVHAWAYQRFIYAPDEARWTENFARNGDHWETDAELIEDLLHDGFLEGDCDAFAKLCWKALRNLDVNSRLVTCWAEDGGLHLVCEASGWILDNRMVRAAPREELERLGYRWIAKSGYQPGWEWTTA